MSLKSTEVKNSSRIIRAILISSFGSSACSQTSYPSIIGPNLYLWMMISKIEFSCKIQLLHRLPSVTFVSKKIDHFLRNVVRGKILFWWFNVNPSSFMYWYGCCCTNVCPRLWFCFWRWPLCKHLDACLCTRSSCGSAGICVVLIWIGHIFNRSIRNSDPRMRIVFIHRQDSIFNSIFEVLKTGRDFQYKPNSHVSLNPSFCLRSWIISRQSVFATSHWAKLS